MAKWAREVNQMDDWSLSEKRKYEKVWRVDSYRNISPGAHGVKLFGTALPSIKGDSITDFGCGSGRASRALKNMGYHPVMVDITRGSLDISERNSDIPFYEESLWQLPYDFPITDWCYCFDVMEHIPIGKVGDVLEGIYKYTRKGGLFHISTAPDTFGRRIGETLHLTVKPATWWLKQMEKHFKVTNCDAFGNRVLFVVAKKER